MPFSTLGTPKPQRFPLAAQCSRLSGVGFIFSMLTPVSISEGTFPAQPPGHDGPPTDAEPRGGASLCLALNCLQV